MPKANGKFYQCSNPACDKMFYRSPSQAKNRAFQYCSRACQHAHYAIRYLGDSNPDWKGGKMTEPKKGYILVRKQDHPRARLSGYVLEHILVAEEMLGRPLEKDERVHHINKNPADNRPENLKVFFNNGEHLRESGHHKVRVQPDCPCGRPQKGHGLCSRHLAQLRRTGKTWDFNNDYLTDSVPKDGKRYTRNIDKICICGKQAKVKGMCQTHYNYFIGHGKLPDDLT